jgi:ribosome-associated translation inhibitor RaiA
VDKINRLLKHFQPDLVHLHGALELQNPRQGFITSLNLRLPVGQIHSAHAARSAPDSLRAAFDDLERQLNKEKELLRGSNGKLARSRPEASEREESMAEAGTPPAGPGVDTTPLT